jgi:hypothetical protein
MMTETRHDHGELLCNHCPSTFHHECLGLPYCDVAVVKKERYYCDVAVVQTRIITICHYRSNDV